MAKQNFIKRRERVMLANVIVTMKHQNEWIPSPHLNSRDFGRKSNFQEQGFPCMQTGGGKVAEWCVTKRPQVIWLPEGKAACSHAGIRL